MVIQQPTQLVQAGITTTCSQPITTIDEHIIDRSSMIKEQKPADEMEQRQEMMDKVLESLKRKKVYSRATNGKFILNLPLYQKQLIKCALPEYIREFCDALLSGPKTRKLTILTS
jgi:hypothetical protein